MKQQVRKEDEKEKLEKTERIEQKEKIKITSIKLERTKNYDEKKQEKT